MISIRNYQPNDAAALWALFFNTIRRVNIRDYTAEQVAAWAPDNYPLELWQKKMQAISPFVAEIRLALNDAKLGGKFSSSHATHTVSEGADRFSKIVGYSDLQPSGLIDHFFCHHQHQGCGVGRALMQHIFALGRTRGIARLHSEVSISARPFYEHMGFELYKEQSLDLRGQRLRNFVMHKTL
ncbi:GNAT family N-acetyltransferase [Agaribacterium haliotis]|uniref:GNAT family N-acetyltransferase n=1 Tax=Agaribacterium haliotis TaxID=2013869 RepID=UPI000BB564F2|nr:GNAT family N-acetyltransferase [Agaribacterium haliotis]